MRWGKRGRGRALQLAGGSVVGIVAGTVVFGSGLFAPSGDARPGGSSAVGVRDVLHSPPLLAGRNEALPLRFEIVCQADELGSPCPASGRLFVRSGRERPYQELSLARGGESTLFATVPAWFTRGSGLDYYAVIADGIGGSRTVPAGGADAPQRVWTPDELVTVELGRHVFGRTRPADGSPVRARWGSGRGEAGLITGDELVRIGPSAFDVQPGGSVVLLDQVNERLSVFPPAGGLPRQVHVPFAGAEGDLTIDGDGSIHILDHGGETVVRSYRRDGTAMATANVDGRGADMLRTTPAGPAVHGYPGDMWFPVRRGAAPMGDSEQVAAARAGRPVANGLEVVVRAGSQEAMFALAAGEHVVRGWRVTSSTSLGEVQLVEPFGDGILVVVRVWTQSEAEFVALVLSRSGLARSFSIDAVEWAESAPLARFRLQGRTLYQLRSAASGAEIVTFDLGGVR